MDCHCWGPLRGKTPFNLTLEIKDANQPGGYGLRLVDKSKSEPIKAARYVQALAGIQSEIAKTIGRDSHVKRRVERERKLEAFQIDLGELEALISLINTLFTKASKIRCKIEVPLEKEQLVFDDVEEMRNYPVLRGKIKKFFVRISDGDCSITFSSGCGLFYKSSARAESDSDAWCAGAIETIVSFLRTRRVWYHWFVYWPFSTMIFAMVGIPYLLKALTGADLFTNKSFAVGWVTILLTFMVISLGRDTLLPSGAIVINSDEGIFRRRAPELSLLIALLSAVLTVIGWFVGK